MNIPQRLLTLLPSVFVRRTWRHRHQLIRAGDPALFYSSTDLMRRVYGYRLRRLSEYWQAKKPARKPKADAPVLPFDGEK